MAGKPIHGERMQKSIFVRFDPKVDKILREIAEREDRPIARVVREMVREGLVVKGQLEKDGGAAAPRAPVQRLRRASGAA